MGPAPRRSEPSGAVVRLGSVGIGLTPLSRAVPVGPQALTVSHRDHPPLSTTVEVRPGRPRLHIEP